MKVRPHHIALIAVVGIATYVGVSVVRSVAEIKAAGANIASATARPQTERASGSADPAVSEPVQSEPALGGEALDAEAPLDETDAIPEPAPDLRELVYAEEVDRESTRTFDPAEELGPDAPEPGSTLLPEDAQLDAPDAFDETGSRLPDER